MPGAHLVKVTPFFPDGDDLYAEGCIEKWIATLLVL